MFQKNDSIQSLNDVVKFYDQFFPKPNGIKMGIEWERIGIDKETKMPAGYETHYEKIIQGLHEKHGWEIQDEEAGHIFTLRRDRTLITTEGDGKPEISGDRFTSLWENKAEIDEISEEMHDFDQNVEWYPMGLQPFHDYPDIPLAPKKRYKTFYSLFVEYKEWMRRYMKALCGLHINIGADSERDLTVKAQALYRLSPVLCGAFANSPLFCGKPSGSLSTRRKLIFEVPSPGREEMPLNFLDSDFSLEKWLEFFFGRDIITVFRGERTICIPPKHRTFQYFFENGIEGERPVFEDVDRHIKTSWVDIRPRIGYLEFRPLDSLPLDHLFAVSAFVKGICMSSECQEAVVDLTKDWKESEYPEIHKKAYTKGLSVTHAGISFSDILQQLLPLAEKSLENLENKNDKGEDERAFLAPLYRILETGKTPAEEFLDTQS